MTAFRLSPDRRAELDSYCIANNITISDCLRSLVEGLLAGQHEQAASIEVYKQAKALAVQLAEELIRGAASSLPSTLEEFEAQYGSQIQIE